MSLYPNSSIFTVTETMERLKNESESVNECVEMNELEKKQTCKDKIPRRVIHFSNGELMEEYSTDEEDGPDKEPQSALDTTALPWGPFMMFHMWRAATSTVSACDYVGERMASLFGMTTAKYQYAIDQHNRANKNKEEERVRDIQGSEEVESHFEEKPSEKIPEQQISQSE